MNVCWVKMMIAIVFHRPDLRVLCIHRRKPEGVFYQWNPLVRMQDVTDETRKSAPHWLSLFFPFLIFSLASLSFILSFHIVWKYHLVFRILRAFAVVHELCNRLQKCSFMVYLEAPTSLVPPRLPLFWHEYWIKRRLETLKSAQKIVIGVNSCNQERERERQVDEM